MPLLPHVHGVLPGGLLSRSHSHAPRPVPGPLADAADSDVSGALALLNASAGGLGSDEAARRLGLHGPNVLARDARPGLLLLLWRAVRNPLVVLLACLAAISLATGDARAAVVMGLMIALGVTLRWVQEARAGNAAAKLKALLSVKATVLRDGELREVDVSQLVPGDVVHLSAGDMVPADVRILQARDLFVVQGTLTGESFPVEKFPSEGDGPRGSVLERHVLAFLGTSVSSGSATALVVATGPRTYLGGMAEALQEAPAATSFDRGVARYTRLMLGFMAVMVPVVFLVNGLLRHDWGGAFFFAVAVAVGLTPEMLPMVVTLCLSKGAIAMGRRKVIVKRLAAIQDLGAMDVLCTDKTGTLTQDRVMLERYCDVALREDARVLSLAYVNSHFQTGLRSLLDRAVLAHEEAHAHGQVPALQKVDEIPFDFERRVMSVVVREPGGAELLVAKGAPEALFPRCVQFRLGDELLPMDHPHIEQLKAEHDALAGDGFRVLAVATRSFPSHPGPYGRQDEAQLTLEGYLAFLDPPRETAASALKVLAGRGIRVKVITGDNEAVARKVCSQVGLEVGSAVLGEELDSLTDAELAATAESSVLFARVSPAHKQRIVRALQANGHTVGFLGDGINDAPALHAADVGISVDTAVDIAREAADVVLLERSLQVLADGVLEGRKVFANILKYVRMGASSNFGNMFSVLGASVLVPFLPMRPIQVLLNNLLYDVGQAAVPTDDVDEEQLLKPRAWDLGQLTRFILLIGPCSSVFDYTTYWVMLHLFGCADVSTPAAAAHSEQLFQAGWFVESLVTQSFIIHVIRTNKVPFLQSRGSATLVLTGLLVMAVGLWLPGSPLGPALGFAQLPPAYWGVLAATSVSYLLLTQGVKWGLLRLGWI